MGLYVLVPCEPIFDSCVPPRHMLRSNQFIANRKRSTAAHHYIQAPKLTPYLKLPFLIGATPAVTEIHSIISSSIPYAIVQ